MKKTKIINLMCLSLILFFSLIIGVNKSAKVYAETANAETAGAETETTETAKATFEMVYGASIRIGEGQVNGKDMTNGLRFQVKMDETTAKSIDGTAKKLYVLIVPAVIVDLTSDAQIEAHKSAIVSYKEKWIPVAVDSIYESVAENGKNYYFANAMICNLTSDFYGVKFNAVAIIEESGEYTYAKASSAARSIYDVVNSAVLDVYADKIIGSEVAANTKLDYAKWYGTEEYPVAPKTPAQFNKYNELKSTTLKNLSIERQDVMVNNPVVTIGEKNYNFKIPEVHGEQDVEVIVEGATVTVPVTIIDDVITDFETFKSYTMYSTSESVDLKNKGKYFVLGGDIDASGKSVSSYVSEGSKKTVGGDNIAYGKGFAGTIDGRGYSINNLECKTGSVNDWIVQGLFGALTDATIKNITFNVSSLNDRTDNYFSMFAWYIKGGIFRNITINIPEGLATKLPHIFAIEHNSGKFIDVTVNAPGVTIQQLLARVDSTTQYASAENLVVDAEEVKYIYGDVTTKEGIIVPKNVVLTENVDIVMTDDVYALNLGEEYAALTINSITCDGISLGTDLAKLDLSAFKSDYTKHGNKTITVKGRKDGGIVKITVPVTLVTKMISTQTELRSVVTTLTDTTVKAIFGYYKLANDIDYSDGFHNGDPGFSWWNSKQGFRATLDGNGKTITGFAHNQGLFNSIGEGAVIKNINFVSTRWSGANDRLFGIASYGATFENVNIVMRSEDGSKVPSVHLLFADACQNNTFKNVTLKVYSDNGSTLAGLSTVFGKNFTGNTCKGVKIYCASITELGKDSSLNSVKQYDGIEIIIPKNNKTV